MKTGARATCSHHVADPGSIEVSQVTVLPPGVGCRVEPWVGVTLPQGVARIAEQRARRSRPAATNTPALAVIATSTSG